MTTNGAVEEVALSASRSAVVEARDLLRRVVSDARVILSDLTTLPSLEVEQAQAFKLLEDRKARFFADCDLLYERVAAAENSRTTEEEADVTSLAARRDELQGIAEGKLEVIRHLMEGLRSLQWDIASLSTDLPEEEGSADTV